MPVSRSLSLSAALFGSLLLWTAGAIPAQAKGDYLEGTEALAKGDYRGAIEAWEPLAEDGDPRAQYALGFLYQFGQGVPRNFTKAVQYYQKAADQGDPDAQYALGMLVEQGLGVEKKDQHKALDLYRRAADSNLNPNADYAVGRFYMNALGVPRNVDSAFQFFKKAAAKGHPAAAYALASILEVGTDRIPENLPQAWFWYSVAAKVDLKQLKEYDITYDPKAALAAVKERISAADLQRAEGWLKHGAIDDSKAEPGKATSKDKGEKAGTKTSKPSAAGKTESDDMNGTDRPGHRPLPPVAAAPEQAAPALKARGEGAPPSLASAPKEGPSPPEDTAQKKVVKAPPPSVQEHKAPPAGSDADAILNVRERH